ncbi:MAG: lysylphosphatidylglycerol synthase transmembrane domain-containing protein [Candidatus Omnitrophota bacterium]
MKKFFFIIRVIISISLIGFLFWMMRDKLPLILHTIKSTNKNYLLIGLAFYLVSGILISLRMKTVISVQGIHFTLKESVYLTLMGYFFNNFLPTSIGGDVVKAYYAGKRINNKGAAFAGIFMDRFLAMIPYTLIPAITLIFFHHKIDNRALITAVYVVFFGAIVFLWLFLHRKTVSFLAAFLEPFEEQLWYRKIRDGYEFLNKYSKHKKILIKTLLLAASVQILVITAVFFFAKAVGATNVHLGVFFLVVPIVGVISLLPSVNGLGIRESGFVYLLKGYMFPEQAFAVSILFLMALSAVGIMGGIVYAAKRDIFTVKTEELE